MAAGERQAAGGSEAVRERRSLEARELLLAVQGLTELPMVLLALGWLALLIAEFTVPLTPAASRWVTLGILVIWVLFIAEFLLGFYLAPNRLEFLRQNWITGLALLVPALRVVRVVRAVLALRAISTFRVVAVTNRSLRKLGLVFAGQKLLYVFASLSVVMLTSAAGVFLMERGAPGSQIQTYGDALWWAAATVTAVGSALDPVTPEARVLGFLTMLFGVSVVGYVAATLAALFLRVEALEREEEAQAAAAPDVEPLRRELRALEERLATLREALGPPGDRRGG